MADQLEIEYLPPDSITENPENPRQHPASQLRLLA